MKMNKFLKSNMIMIEDPKDIHYISQVGLLNKDAAV